MPEPQGWTIEVCSECNDPTCEAPMEPVPVQVVALDDATAEIRRLSAALRRQAVGRDDEVGRLREALREVETSTSPYTVVGRKVREALSGYCPEGGLRHSAGECSWCDQAMSDEHRDREIARIKAQADSDA